MTVDGVMIRVLAGVITMGAWSVIMFYKWGTSVMMTKDPIVFFLATIASYMTFMLTFGVLMIMYYVKNKK